MIRAIAAMTFVALMTVTGIAKAAVEVKKDPNGKIIEISGLFQDTNGACGHEQLSGRIVKRNFSDDHLSVMGIQIEAPDGTLHDFNIFYLEHLDKATERAVRDGLRRLTKPGRIPAGQAFSCGPYGAVTAVDTIR